MADSLKRLKLRKLPLNRAIISDILLWVVLTLALAYAIYFFAIVLPAKRGQVITLHFHNANEISKGSPVRMMGTDIGFVSDLKVEHDDVAVTIQTDPGTLPIPSGATFNILFTGLAGAKSVEIEVPDSPQPTINGQPVYQVEEPVRMRDALNASIDATQSLQKGAENITDFFGKKKPVEELQFNIRQAHQISMIATRNTATLNRAITDIHHAVRDNTTTGISTLGELTPGFAQAVSITNPTTARPELQRFFESLRRLSMVWQTPKQDIIGVNTLQRRLGKFNQWNTQLGRVSQSLAPKLQTAPINQCWQTAYSTTDHISSSLDRAARVTQGNYLPALKRSDGKIRELNLHLQQINAKLSNSQTKSTPTKP